MIEEFIDLIPYNLRLKVRTNYEFLIKDLKYHHTKKYESTSINDFEIYELCAVLNVIYNGVIRESDSLNSFFKINSLDNKVKKISIGSSKFSEIDAKVMSRIKSNYYLIISKYNIPSNILEITDSYVIFNEIYNYVNEVTYD